ncbi:hypothetical protein BRAS3843_1480008 [Bradyrhizobium sp. STM 3843]|nr:hypothetical protein BRAS3843_1480008 [Bradyrhizobium sp. STM 3843]
MSAILTHSGGLQCLAAGYRGRRKRAAAAVARPLRAVTLSALGRSRAYLTFLIAFSVKAPFDIDIS